MIGFLFESISRRVREAKFPGAPRFWRLRLRSRRTPFRAAEPDAGSVSSTLNWLRAGVLGPTMGIVSTARIVVGVPDAGDPSTRTMMP